MLLQPPRVVGRRPSSPPSSQPHPIGPFDRRPFTLLPASPFTGTPTLLSCVALYQRSRPLLVAFLLCSFIIGYPAFEQHPHFSLSDARLPAGTLSPLPPTRERLLFACLYTPPYRVSFYSLFLHPDYATISTIALPARRLAPTTLQGTPVPWVFPPPFASPSQTSHPHCHPFVLGFLVCSRGSSDFLASPTFSVSFPRLESGQPFTSL